MDKAQLEKAIKVLALYDEKVSELHNSSFANAVFNNSGIDISFERDKSGFIGRRGPTDESIRAWAPSIRLLISKRDRISFNEMHTLYSQLPLDPAVLETLKSHKDDVDRILSEPSNTGTNTDIKPLRIAGKEPTVMEFLETFIYGDILHLDENKRENYVNWRSDQLIFVFAQDRFCFLSAHIINLAVELIGFNAWITKRLNEKIQELPTIPAS